MRSKINLVGDLIGLDLGQSRTGVARVSTYAKLAEPLDEIAMDDQFFDKLHRIINEYEAACVVAGVPRGLNGQETEQTKWALKIIAQMQDVLGVPVFSVDEAVTTKIAEERAKDGQSVDSVAACIIVEDFLSEVMRGNVEGVNVSA